MKTFSYLRYGIAILLLCLGSQAHADTIATWGNNDFGQLGRAGASAVTPTSINTSGVLAGKTISQISQGTHSNTACVIANGGAFCWGSGANGQLGNGSAGPSSVAVAVSGLSTGVTQIYNGLLTSCAVVSGKAWCWGWSYSGSLGDGVQYPHPPYGSSVPVQVYTSDGPLAGKTIAQVAVARDTACALTSEGKVSCWGEAYANGTSSSINSNKPVAIQGDLANLTVSRLVSGYRNFCALASDGQAWCWGIGYHGNGTTMQSTQKLPAPMTTGVGTAVNGQPITDLAMSGAHGCLAAGGKAYCWGENTWGQLGLGVTGPAELYPVAVRAQPGDALNGKTVSRVAAGGILGNVHHSCAVADGKAYCWGAGNDGQTGLASTSTQLLPTAVFTASGPLAGATVSGITTGGNFTSAQILGGPGLSGVSAVANGNSGGTLTGTSSADATGYYLVVTTGSPAPTVTEIKAGGSGYAGIVRASGSGNMNAMVASSYLISGLSAGTAYTAYLVASNSNGDSSSSSASFTTVANVTGNCGGAHGNPTAVSPGSNLCTAGTATAVNGNSGAWRWSCTGSGNGSTASCVAPYQSQSIGNFTANPGSLLVGEGGSLTATASSGLSVQFASNTPAVCSVTGPGYSALAAGTCTVTASQPGTGDSGSSRFLAATPQSRDIAVRQNGLCGSANGVATATPPSSNLCATGAASLISGSNGAWRWSCNGLNGGTSDTTCAATYASQTLSLSIVPTTVAAYSAATITADASSGLTPTLSTVDGSVCLLTSTGGAGIAYGVAEGICNVSATQAGTGDSGSARYLAASSAVVGVSITPACIVGPDDHVIDRRTATSAQTINGVSTKRNVIWGSAYADTINGGSKGNCIDGGPGNDRISGNAGDNELFGGLGNDTVTPGSGANFMDGGPGTDRCLKVSSRATAVSEDCESQ